MAAAWTGRPPGGSGDDAPDAASPPAPPPARQESILPICPNDQKTTDDTLGFTPYARALASFLTHPATKAPLAISIEGEWGSGKSSFMEQLEGHINEAEKGRKTDPPSLMVRFNPWRHDKEEALWAAFALEFLRQVREQRPLAPRWRCDLSLFFRRFSWKSGWSDLLRALALWLCFLSVPAAVALLALFRGTDYIRTAVEFLTRQCPAISGTSAHSILDWFFHVSGWAGCAALVVYLLKYIKRLVGSPLEVDLQKHLKAPRYEGSVSFAEKFHRDFRKVVDAYAGKRRVYVFVDDLDRCQVPRAADLMQAINLMISDDPRLVFVIGMDWEKVAAGIAVKNTDLVKCLKRSVARKEAAAKGTDATLKSGAASKDEDSALEFGREFLEKFIQLRFALPRPGEEDIKRLLQTLSPPQASPIDMGLRRRARGLWASLQSKLSRARGQRIPAPEKEAQHQATVVAPSARPKELIEFRVDGDSETIRDVTLALAPAFRNNPRRVKRFLGLFRLRTFIAKETGLLASAEGQLGSGAITLEQLGKFTALELLWPLLLQEAEQDGGLLTRLEEQATGRRDRDEGWVAKPSVSEFFAIGRPNREPGTREAPDSMRDWSIGGLDVSRLRRVSPYVGPFEERVVSSTEEVPTGAASTEGSPLAKSFLLSRRRVPFKFGQYADFAREQIPSGSRGFTLTITPPEEPYWRCGFVVAPEDYIYDGRTDVTISQYFLFHIGQGHLNAQGQFDPNLPTGLHYRMYEQEKSEREWPFNSESPVRIHVELDWGEGRVRVVFGDKNVEAALTPAYFRHLYILAWADSQPPCHVAAELRWL